MLFSLCTVVDEQPTLPVVAGPRCSMTTSGRFGPEVAPPTAAPAPAPTTAPTGPPTTAPPTAPAVAPAAAPWSVARASVGRAKRAAAEARARIELRMGHAPDVSALLGTRGGKAGSGPNGSGRRDHSASATSRARARS